MSGKRYFLPLYPALPGERPRRGTIGAADPDDVYPAELPEKCPRMDYIHYQLRKKFEFANNGGMLCFVLREDCGTLVEPC